MTEEQKKEALSKSFLRILAEGHGFKVTEPPLDHGVDMNIVPVGVRTTPQGKLRYFDTQYRLDFQLKATTVNGIIDAGSGIKFDLEVKNYNDLIHRRGEVLPLHLVVVVLNSAPPTCITMEDTHLRLGCCAYWYLPPQGAVVSNNDEQIRITIPKANLIASSFIHSRFLDLGIDL